MARSASAYEASRYFPVPGLRPKKTRDAAEQAPALVIRPCPSRKPRTTVRPRRRDHGRPARIVSWKRGENSFQHPGAAQVQAVEMRQLWIARVGRNGDGQPIAFRRYRDLRQGITEPFREFILWQIPAHRVRFSEARRKKIFAGRFVA